MQQRQLRLGDILDDYCPRERRVTNHAVVAMIGPDVKQTRCTTCDAEHEYKHAKVPRQRRKAETPAVLYSQVLAGRPKRVAHEEGANNGGHGAPSATESAPNGLAAQSSDEITSAQATAQAESIDAETPGEPIAPLEKPGESIEPLKTMSESLEPVQGESIEPVAGESIEPVQEITEVAPLEEEGPVHRPLIRASLPRPEGQPPPSRPIPEFTIRQPGGRPNRFRPRHQRAGQQPFGSRSNGSTGRGGMRQGGGGTPPASRMARRHGPPGRKRSK